MNDLRLGYLFNAAVFAGIGLVVFLAACAIGVRLLPGDFWAEIRREKNVALAVVAGALVIGIALIVAAAVH